MYPKLTDEHREALKNSPGWITVADDQLNRQYILIDSAIFDGIQREANLSAIRRGLADSEAGRTSSIDEVRARLENELKKRSAQE